MKYWIFFIGPILPKSKKRVGGETMAEETTFTKLSDAIEYARKNYEKYDWVVAPITHSNVYE